MSDTCAAYWQAREQTPNDAAKQLVEFLDVLRSAYPDAGAAWFHKGSPSPRPEDAVDTSESGLTHLFAAGVNRRDTDQSVISELGYRANFWNGDNNNPVQLSVKAGATSTVPGITNNVVLKVPSTSAARAGAQSTPSRISWRSSNPIVRCG